MIVFQNNFENIEEIHWK